MELFIYLCVCTVPCQLPHALPSMCAQVCGAYSAKSHETNLNKGLVSTLKEILLRVDVERQAATVELHQFCTSANKL